MGQTIRNLSEKKVKKECVFNNRFVTEICELVHTHYRNLRIIQSIEDWVEFAEGVRDALERWKKLGEPECGNKHIELCRKLVAVKSPEDSVKINLNHNLYAKNEGKIFAEGANIDDKSYIHFKVRDLRIEMTKEEFKVWSEAFKEAEEKLCIEA